MNIKPIGDRVLVRPKKEEEITASGIVLPDTVNKEKKAEGEVIALGAGEELKKLGLKVGDKVIFEKWGGEEIEVEDLKEEIKAKYGLVEKGTKILKILPHDKILAVLE